MSDREEAIQWLVNRVLDIHTGAFEADEAFEIVTCLNVAAGRVVCKIVTDTDEPEFAGMCGIERV